ncbi:hypothetical protein BTR23_13750 [Alkalihalophilus pseudofirmus]|nr:hypothetical protein BTR23_13750 [Alkalihalophilus pseudofirmus]
MDAFRNQDLIALYCLAIKEFCLAQKINDEANRIQQAMLDLNVTLHSLFEVNNQSQKNMDCILFEEWLLLLGSKYGFIEWG